MSNCSVFLHDGGPAFPRTGDTDPRMADYAQSEWHSGMSLRDWFAGQALAMLGDSNVSMSETDIPKLAACCYAMADAMLAERSKP